MNMAAITTIAVTFIILTSFLLILVNLSNFSKYWGERIQVIAYLQHNLSPQQIDNLQDSIRKFEEVESMQFISKEQALKILREALIGQDGLIEGLQGNPLPSSLEIKLKSQFRNLEGVEALVEKIKTLALVDDIEYGHKWLQRFSAIFGLLKIIGFTLGCLLFLATLFIISNTIKLIIYNRRDEIEIMKLVGATNRFIQLPFFIEAIMQGLIGSSIAILFIYIVVKSLSSTFVSSFSFYFGSVDLIFLSFPFIAGIILLGILLGFAGSLLSISSLKEFRI
jgi:cell division transport system permease protein